MNHSKPGLPVHHQLQEFTQFPTNIYSNVLTVSKSGCKNLWGSHQNAATINHLKIHKILSISPNRSVLLPIFFSIWVLTTFRPMHAFILSHFSCVWLCATVDCSPSSSFLHEILQAIILVWLPTPSSRGSSIPRDRICLSCLLHWQFRSIPKNK